MSPNFPDNIFVVSECINATEINQISPTANFDKNGLPMVVNPIYEKEAIYEEIPNSHFTRQEESYVPVTSPGNSHSLSEKYGLVSEILL